MKNFWKLLMVIMLFILTPVFVFAAGSDPPSGINISQYFITLGALAGVVTLLTQWIKQLVFMKAPNFLSWIIAFILSIGGWLLQLGIFVDVAWYWIIIYALAAGLVSNGIFDIKIILAVLGIIPKKINN